MASDCYYTVHPYLASTTTGSSCAISVENWGNFVKNYIAYNNSVTMSPYVSFQPYYGTQAASVTTTWTGSYTAGVAGQTYPMWTWSGTGAMVDWKLEIGCGTFKTRADRLRDLIKRRSGPAILIGRRNPADTEFDEREERARDTLRRVVGEDQYRRFLRHGFVSLKAKSGRVYCVYPGGHYTLVYQGGRMIERLCVVLRGQFPPTDILITRYLMLLNDEAGFRKIANVSSGQDRPAIASVKAHSLLEEIAMDHTLRRTG